MNIHLKRSGFSIVAVVISLAILTGSAFVLLNALQGSSYQVNNQIGRWQSQLAAESVVDAISSLSPTELLAILNANTVYTTKTSTTPITLTSGNQAWLVPWETPGFIEEIKIEIEFYQPEKTPGPTEGLPVVTPITLPISPPTDILKTYDRKFSVSMKWYPFKGSTQFRITKWDRWVNRQ